MKNNLFVKNLSFNTESIDLEKLFSEFGEVVSARVPKSKTNGRSNEIAFVEMKTELDAENVIKNLNGTFFKDSKIKIDFAKDID